MQGDDSFSQADSTIHVASLSFWSGKRMVHPTAEPMVDLPTDSGSLKVIHYVVKVKVGGFAGFLAPLLGKQPPDMHVWVLAGAAPAFVKLESQFYDGGPIWRVELSSPGTFP